MTFSGQPLTASMMEIDLSPSPLYPKARRGGGAYATLTELFSWILFKVVSLTLSSSGVGKLPAEYRGGATRENRISTLLLSRGAAGGARSREYLGPLAGRPHFAVAVVVLVVDMLHGDWLTIMIEIFCGRGLTKSASFRWRYDRRHVGLRDGSRMCTCG
jgi:hypothetical protein